MENRKSYMLNGGWLIDQDPDDKGIEKGWDKTISDTAAPAKVPSIIQEMLPEYHGVAFYWCKFAPDVEQRERERLYLRFEAVDYKAEVFLNGNKLGEHEGGETPFSFDVTGRIKLQEENLLAVRVVNPIERDIDGLNICNVPNRNKMPGKNAGSGLNHGGIWGEVELVVLPAVHIEDVFLTGDIHTGKLSAKVWLKRVAEEPAEKKTMSVCLSMSVYDRKGFSRLLVGQKWELEAKEGCNTQEISLIVPDVRLWDIDDPNLYYIVLELESEFGVHRVVENFGFREFEIRDSYFYLNDRKIFLKSSHTGNNFPVGQGYPVMKEQIRKDMVMAKAYGFNMVRAIAGMLKPEQLAVCDEIGLMVYEECYAAWKLGTDAHMLAGGEQSLGDEAQILKRFDECTLDMVRRDRNHACITAWGLLNEMFPDAAVTRRAKEILPLLREEDPSRVVFLNSGRYDRDPKLGSASNPYCMNWDVTMGADLTEDLKIDKYLGELAFDQVGDMHFYPPFPLHDEWRDYFRNYAKDHKPAFFSETGYGSLFNVLEEAAHFEQYGFRRDLEDYTWIKKQAETLTGDWYRLGLEKVYPSPEMMLKESQRLSAWDRRQLFDMIRSNPHFNGYSVTGLLDHGWCGEGLWSLFRRFKPEMYDTINDGWAPLRFCLFVKHHVYSGDAFETEAVLANENVLKPGRYMADFAITGQYGTVERWSQEFVVKDDAFAVPVMKKKHCLDVPTGKYSLTAHLREGGAPLGNKLDFYVRNKKDIPKVNAELYVYGQNAATVELLKEQGAEIIDWKERGKENTLGAGKLSEKTNGSRKLILAGQDVSEKDIAVLKQAAENGAVVLFLNVHGLITDIEEKNWILFDGEIPKLLEIAEDFQIKKNYEWLYHKECVTASPEVFYGLNFGLMDSACYGQIISPFCMETDRTPEDVICPGFYTGNHLYEGSYKCVHMIAGFGCGKGMIYINTLALEENLGVNPAADVMLLNLVNYLLK